MGVAPIDLSPELEAAPARGVDNLDVRRLLVRDLTELVAHLDGDSDLPNTARDAARNAAAAQRAGQDSPVLVDTPDYLTPDDR